MFRPDGSFDSANNPVSGNRYAVKDFGLYKAQITNVIYVDSEENNTADDRNAQVLYEIRIMGGERDGQIFRNAVELQKWGGISNYSERVWKGTTTLNYQDPASLAVLESFEELNGDVVYIQFINGELYYPVILGGARHAANTFTAASESDGPRLIEKFNGVSTEISKDGEFTWTKANGRYSSIPVLNLNAPPKSLQDQFIEIPGFEEAVQITIGNQFNFAMKMNVTPGQGIEVAVDGTADSFAIATAAGASLEVSGISGISMQDTLGDALSLSNGSVELKNATGAALSFDAAGFIKLGNASGDLLAIIGEAFEALSTQTAAGFGAPTSTVVAFTQLLVKIKLLSGG